MLMGMVAGELGPLTYGGQLAHVDKTLLLDTRNWACWVFVKVFESNHWSVALLLDYMAGVLEPC
jgi:hypothetical protein